MAKKKTAETANIKAAPVLRVEDPGAEPTPDPEETSTTKSYAVRDDWKDINKVNYIAFKSVDGEVQDLTVNGEPAGGGGGGMFTTAKLSATKEAAVHVPYIVTAEGISTIVSEAATEPGVDLDIVLVNGTCIMRCRDTVTGAAELLDAEEGVYKVTGNVTIS